MDEQVLSSYFPFIFSFIVFAVIAGCIIWSVCVRLRKQKRADNSPRPDAERTKRSPYLQKAREKASYIQVDKHAAHVADALAHEHKGEEEHYEEIVGSLGDVNDEGCADLDGVRFIEHDAAYEQNDPISRDYASVVRAMVLGEILNDPRFDDPYRDK